jgi:hypothetical protein|mmetsp:Transcript_6627/g.12522  ORF Transcript_6627/g.12522 Transcript_6627/m.12522 type:complete len:85 (-) Transcript_6627:2658-2912(-)
MVPTPNKSCVGIATVSGVHLPAQLVGYAPLPVRLTLRHDSKHFSKIHATLCLHCSNKAVCARACVRDQRDQHIAVVAIQEKRPL